MWIIKRRGNTKPSDRVGVALPPTGRGGASSTACPHSFYILKKRWSLPRNALDGKIRRPPTPSIPALTS